MLFSVVWSQQTPLGETTSPEKPPPANPDRVITGSRLNKEQVFYQCEARRSPSRQGVQIQPMEAKDIASSPCSDVLVSKY